MPHGLYPSGRGRRSVWPSGAAVASPLLVRRWCLGLILNDAIRNPICVAGLLTKTLEEACSSFCSSSYHAAVVAAKGAGFRGLWRLGRGTHGLAGSDAGCLSTVSGSIYHGVRDEEGDTRSRALSLAESNTLEAWHHGDPDNLYLLLLILSSRDVLDPLWAYIYAPAEAFMARDNDLRLSPAAPVLPPFPGEVTRDCCAHHPH